MKLSRKGMAWIGFILALFLVLLASLSIKKKVRNYIEQVKALSTKLVLIQDEAYKEFEEKKDQSFALKEDTEIYDRNNHKIGNIYKNNFKYTKFEDISKECIDSYIAIEDRRFWNRIGVDYIGILRAAKSNFLSGTTTQGGSTITQQVLKNNIVGNERSYKRKLKEFFLAPVIEKEFGKEKILELYLNTNFYSNNITGIGAASEYYFDKKPSELDYRDTALLIALSNAPTKNNPKDNMENALESIKKNLKVLKDNGLITQEQFDDYTQSEYKIAFKRAKNTVTDNLSTLALYGATLELMKKDGFEFKYDFSSYEDEKKYKRKYYDTYASYQDRLRRGGYRLYTSLDTDIQNKSKEIMNNLMAKYPDNLQSSVVVIDNKTQYMLAGVGGRYNDEFNRSFQALRQPGSLMKPILSYSSAMEFNRLSMEDIEVDEKINDEYSPKNVTGTYMGSVTLREAMARSINTISYKLLRDATLPKAMSLLDKYQIASISYGDRYNYAMSLGGLTRGMSPYEIAKVFSSIVNNGYRDNRNLINSIKVENGKEIFTRGTEPTKPIIDKNLNDKINQINKLANDYDIPINLQAPTSQEGTEISKDKRIMSIGTAQSLVQGMIHVAHAPYGSAYRLTSKLKIKDEYGAKTGTTTDAKDAWTTIVTPKYTVTAWVGYDSPKDTHLYGGSLPLDIAAGVMQYLYDRGEYQPEKFRTESAVPVTVSNKLITSINTDKSRGYIGIEKLLERLLLDRDLYEQRLIQQQKEREEQERLEEERRQQEEEMLKQMYEDDYEQPNREGGNETINIVDDMETISDMERIFKESFDNEEKEE